MTHPQLAAVVEQALRAPSVHNTQPWLWRILPDMVELHADRNRHLTVTDPDGRDLLLSCGAALHHLQVALAARDLHSTAARFPDPDNSAHLATVQVRPGPAGVPVSPDAALFPAIAERRTDRRRMSHRPVPPGLLRSLTDRAGRAGATLLAVTTPHRRRELVDAIATAATVQRTEPGYASELRMWTNRLPGGHDGVPATHVPAPPVGTLEPSPLRRFTRAELAQPPQRPGHGPPNDAAALLILATAADGPLDRLRAGEAASAVLLTATRLGLATTPLSQAIETDACREHLRRDVLAIPEHPQLVIRVGWPASGAVRLPTTPRRELRTVLLPELPPG